MTQLPLDPAGSVVSGDEVDGEARRVIAEALDSNLFVEAGAGTGKTRALVDRIVALVRKGTPIERIVAITFTDRAAAELRERVRRGLEDEISSAGDTTGRIATALASLDRAQISTIHSFCQAIVRVYSAEAGVDPDFDVQDELMTKRRMQERWRLFLEKLGNDETARAQVDRLLSLGLRVNELEDLALELAERGEVAELLSRQAVLPEPRWPDLAALADEMRSLRIERADPDDRLYARAVAIQTLLEALIASEETERAEILAGAAATVDPDRIKQGYAKNWGGTQVMAHVQDTTKAIACQLNDFLRDARAAALSAVMPRIVEFVLLDERERGREGKLTFDDLILRAKRLLGESSAAVASLRSRYDVLLIDEFQDTDPLQVEIAKAFATDPASGAIEPGRLFLVGDPKQSIYRFRRADMATYAHTRKEMVSAGARTPQLRQNRRSQKPVIDWVNEIFAEVIGRTTEREVQPEYVPIELGRDAKPKGPGVQTFGGKCDALAREVRIYEADDVAAVCREAVSEKWEVEERPGVIREAMYRDIAILLPRRTGLTALERALGGAGIPYRVEGGSLIYRTQEIRDLTNILTAIDNPADEIAIVAALRSPAFACSDVDLARHRARGGRFDYERIDFVTPGTAVIDGLRMLNGFHRVRHNTSLAGLVERVVLECGLVETGILDQGDRNSFRRARFMVERARAFEAGGPESLRAFVQWLEQQSDAAMMDNEGGALDDDEDAVRVLTVHGAKGLEFPIVILAGTAAQLNNNFPPVYTADFASERVAICIGHKGVNRRFTLGDFDALNALEEQHAGAEFDRLLYVAATRARDHLLVSLYHRKGSNACAAQRLITAGADQTPLRKPKAAADTGGRAQLDAMRVELPPGITSENFAETRERLLESAKQVEYTSATALAPRGEKKDEATDESEPWAHGRGGTRLGRAVHATIQSLPLDADDDTIAAFSRAQAVAEAIPHREREVARLVRWVVHESGAWKRARAARRAMREVPFALATDGRVLEGFVDLVIQSEDGIEIVDWKTDQISAADVPERLRQYELQAGLYTHGLESATRAKVRAITYVFAHAQAEESPGEPGELANKARERLARGTIASASL